MTNDRKDLTLEFEQVSDAELWALAEFVKRATWSEFRANAVDDDEAYRISDGVAKLQKALDDAGYSPR